jgi:hypothetical protein
MWSASRSTSIAEHCLYETNIYFDLRLPRRNCGLAFSARLRQLGAGKRNVGQAFVDDSPEKGQSKVRLEIIPSVRRRHLAPMIQKHITPGIPRIHNALQWMAGWRSLSKRVRRRRMPRGFAPKEPVRISGWTLYPARLHSWATRAAATAAMRNGFARNIPTVLHRTVTATRRRCQRRPDAWCSACDKSSSGGQWTEATERAAGVKLLCGACYDAAKAQNGL